MIKRSRILLKQFLSLFSVFLLVTGLPLLGAHGAPLKCEKVHARATSQRGSSSQWTQTKTLEGKIEYIISAFTKGSKTFYEARDFAKRIQALPEVQQKQWMLAIGRAYRKVPKKDPNPLAASHIGGRRLLDHALTLLENYQVRFQEEIEQNAVPPREAYRRFLNRQAELFGTSYDSKAVEVVIRTLQAELRKLPTQGGGPLAISIAGSFPNGKADLLSSDIDLSLSNGGVLQRTQGWQAEIQRAFEAEGIVSNLELAFSTEPPQFYGKINPIILKVTADEVQMMVFPAAGLYQSGDQLSAGSPQIYLFAH